MSRPEPDARLPSEAAIVAGELVRDGSIREIGRAMYAIDLAPLQAENATLREALERIAEAESGDFMGAANWYRAQARAALLGRSGIGV